MPEQSLGAGAGEGGGVDLGVVVDDRNVGAEIFLQRSKQGFVGRRGVEWLARRADAGGGDDQTPGRASWRIRADHVDAAQTEERSGGEEVAVVRVDLSIAVLRRAGEVQGVGGPQKTVAGAVW